MHRLIIQAPKGLDTDHINGNRLDNRRKNLRICTHQQNIWNSVKNKYSNNDFKGVYFVKRTNNWEAKIVRNTKRYYLGKFKTELEAANTYNLKAKELFGEYAKIK